MELWDPLNETARNFQTEKQKEPYCVTEVSPWGVICIPLEGVRSTDHYGVYEELNDRGRCTEKQICRQTEKQICSAPDYMYLFSWLYYITKTIYVSVGGSPGKTNLRAFLGLWKVCISSCFSPCWIFKDLSKWSILSSFWKFSGWTKHSGGNAYSNLKQFLMTLIVCFLFSAGRRILFFANSKISP